MHKRSAVRRLAVLGAALVMCAGAAAQQATPAPVTPAVPPVTPGIAIQPERTPQPAPLPAEDARLAVCAAPAIPGFAAYTGPAAPMADLLAGSSAFTPAQVAGLNCLDDSAAFAPQAALWLPADAFAAGAGITPQDTPAGITGLRLSASVAEGGDVRNLEGITLAWASPAPSVHLRLCPPAAREDDAACISPHVEGQAIAAPGSGSLRIPLFWRPGEYRLEVDADGERQSLRFRVQCSSESLAETAPALCPEQPPLVVSGAVQPFEHGWMLWFADRLQILVLTDDGRARAFTDTYREGMADPADVAPPGLMTPVRGFGRVWAWLGGAQGSGLGWARALETGISIFRQPAGRSSYTTYLSLPDLPGGPLTLALSEVPGAPVGYWSILPPAAS